MKQLEKLAVIGSGPSSLYVLKHLLDEVAILGKSIESIMIFEKEAELGFGMPYNPMMTDRYNLSNISSEEIPDLPEAFHHWLSARNSSELSGWGIDKSKLSEAEVYGRIPLGCYLRDQYRSLIRLLDVAGVSVYEKSACEVVDLHETPSAGRVILVCRSGDRYEFDKVVIATGHQWGQPDRPPQGYYSSPWPISKILPAEGESYHFAIGTMGASLSAFDVVASLAHRHGEFIPQGQGFVFRLREDAEGFRMVMHSANGLLPHLQWDQVEPFREIYRHVTREVLLGMLDSDGFLRLETFFEHVCKPALRHAFNQDEMREMAALLADSRFGIDDFVEAMTARHQYVDSFAGMAREMVKARQSVENRCPIHWKEVLDDLMYCLNFHAELIPAEDQKLLRKSVLPFVMNVIAAMPLSSGETLLALHEAGVLELVKGKVTLDAFSDREETTSLKVEGDDGEFQMRYRMFIDCSGQKPMELADFPFPGLVSSGAVREARARFVNAVDGRAAAAELGDLLGDADGVPFLRLGGIDVDASYRVVGQDGDSNPRIHDLAFPHTSGVRPYSYGLQACDAAAAILVRTWRDDFLAGTLTTGDVLGVSKIYDEI